MKKGAIRETFEEVFDFAADPEFAPERIKMWNLIWYGSMTALYFSKKPIVKGIALTAGLYSTFAQQKNMATWMQEVRDGLNLNYH